MNLLRHINKENFFFLISQHLIFLFLIYQVQQDKDKILYELDELQAQMEKHSHTVNRIQTEADDYRMDAERHREKCDKLQVGLKLCIKNEFREGNSIYLLHMCVNMWK